MKKLLLCGVVFLVTVLMAGAVFAEEPTGDEKRFYDVLKYKYNLHKDLAPESIDVAMGTMNNELVITFPCPNPPPTRGKIKIKTSLVSWAERTAAGFYKWKCSWGVEEDEKVMECENEISFDLDKMLPEPGLDKQAGNVGVFYHEWLHGQLLINAMNTADWQANFCRCNVNFDQMDSNHTVTPGLQENFTKALESRVVNMRNPWNSTGNESDRDGDGIMNEDDERPDSFDRTDEEVTEPPTLGEVIEEMQTEIVAMNLKGIEPALISITDNVLKSLEKGNRKAAANQMQAFANLVEAQRGRKILERYAGILIKYAENIINQIETQLPPPTDNCQCSCSVSTSEPVTTERFVSLSYSYSMDCSNGDCRIAKAFVNAATSCSDGTSGGSYWEAPNLIAETSFFRRMQDVWCHQSIALTVRCSDGAECADVWSKLIFIPAYEEEGSAEN